MSKPFLVLFRGGPASQLQVVERAAAQNFDIGLSWSGPAAPIVPGAAFVHAAEGSRWHGLAQTLAAKADVVSRYSHVWMPDERLQWTSEDISRLFAVCDRLGLELAQPAFVPSSAGVQPIARRHDGFQLRFTNLVDAAAPVFARGLLGAALPTLAPGDTGVWSQLSRPGLVAVVDATTVAFAPGATPVPAAHAEHALNLGGLLESGDALCFGERAGDVEAMLEALMRACRGLDLGAPAFARYLAQHLAFAATSDAAALRAALEHELAPAAMSFNCAPRPVRAGATERDAAAAMQRPAAAPDAVQRLALCEADLRDLRARHRVVIDERERQQALLAALAQQLGRARQTVAAAPEHAGPAGALQ